MAFSTLTAPARELPEGAKLLQELEALPRDERDMIRDYIALADAAHTRYVITATRKPSQTGSDNPRVALFQAHVYSTGESGSRPAGITSLVELETPLGAESVTIHPQDGCPPGVSLEAFRAALTLAHRAQSEWFRRTAAQRLPTQAQRELSLSLLLGLDESDREDAMKSLAASLEG